MARTRSMILIEVVAALALLGTTIVAILVVRSRSLVQLQTAGERLQATQLARELITDWRLRQINVTRDDHGEFEFEPEPGPGPGSGWSWRRSVSSVVVADKAELTLITLEIVRRSSSAQYRPDETCKGVCGYCPSAKAAARVYADRTVGRHRDHYDPYRAAVACGSTGA